MYYSAKEEVRLCASTHKKVGGLPPLVHFNLVNIAFSVRVPCRTGIFQLRADKNSMGY